ncbi:Na/Pi cotransporter family protein [Murimonas intestini]|uniref:Phosphate:Na+ symporter n=1 Tax=Murimonas intestini TaxID=1337051 RepID=A0AB73TAN6_9FIRM|nr:Na/Pi cotransporter family protein [Murimonas intestini]MCR1838779.1 Na/Pi cotransporter family protein [Murimonas intestini]MCR1864079.1 Na/Pi cotransporter family protein [Murimonas intestini]MCR1881689.1 Na/Pi cotransporter family protein [Murimonas intestini]
MSINDIENLFLFIGGLGMFLFGMHSMSDGIQKSTGSKMRELLGILTNNRFMAVIVGALITAIIQSSGATTVMVVGFVNAGIMTLGQAIGVIMGANIGTCITSWIVSLGQLGDTFKAVSPSLYAPLLVGVGAFFIMFAKKAKKKTAGEIIIGLGLLFIGLDFMKNSAADYTELPIFTNAFALFGSNPFLGIAIGALVTGIMQSSSASVGILQTLAATGGVVTTASAVYISLGSNIGSCFTALLSSLGAPRNAKRAAVMHLSFNVIGAVIFGIAMYFLFRLRPTFADGSIGSVGISIFHTIFNIICTILIFPFADKLVSLSGVFVKSHDDDSVSSEDEEVVTLRHLDDRILETPSFAVENAILEVVHMGRTTHENLQRAFNAVLNYDQQAVDKVYETEKTINSMEKMITEYLVKISNLSLNEDQHNIINDLFYSVSDIERVGDHTENIAELIDRNRAGGEIVFSDDAREELKEIMDLVDNSFSYAMSAREKESIDDANQVVKYEDMVDNMEEELRETHIERLSKQLCKPTNGVVFLDIISNLERISDHAYNLAGYVMSEQ